MGETKKGLHDKINNCDKDVKLEYFEDELG
jgi:hypothetical protein